jgi:polyisoprenoid-binding protein YceI
MLYKLIFAAALAATVPSVAQPAKVDAARSTVAIHVYKTGLFSALAHDHLITAPVASGSIDKEHRSVSLTFNANDLKVGDTEGSESDHQEIEATMKGPTVLNAAQFPVISFQSKRVNVATPESYQVIGDLKLHGQTREITLPVVFSGGIYKGSVHLKQTDYGITPVKVAGGTVRVKDEIAIDFDIVAQ